MTKLSVNLNKIALLRNSRGRDYPNVVEFAKKFIKLGVHGITIHPRPDERHATRKDALELGALIRDIAEIEFNIEGYPSKDFLDLVIQAGPDQCTLVPDAANQITSDHGWDVKNNSEQLKQTLGRLSEANIRSSLFLDPDCGQIEAAALTGADRIELYTEEFANTFSRDNSAEIWNKYKNASKFAEQNGLGVNAGHDLDLNNLGKFLEIGNIFEVSIGHALTIECIDRGIEHVVSDYLAICES